MRISFVILSTCGLSYAGKTYLGEEYFKDIKKPPSCL